MIKQADRYTQISLHNSELEDRLNAAGKLGLHWLVLADKRGGEQYSFLCLFFDAAGKDNYLARVYGQVADEIREIIAGHEKGELEPLDALALIDDVLQAR